MVILGYGAELTVFFGRYEVSDEVPVFEEPTDSAMFTGIPCNKGGDECSK